MRYLFVVILLVLFFADSCKFIEEKGWFGKKADTLEAFYLKQDSIRRADSIRQHLELKAKEQARLDSIRMVEQEEIERLARFKYHIIVGSFKTPEYADLYSEFYSNMGYKTEILYSNNDFNLVSARAFDNIRDAIKDLENFRDTVELDAWIYINE
jgi:hypothetical protein